MIRHISFDLGAVVLKPCDLSPLRDYLESNLCRTEEDMWRAFGIGWDDWGCGRISAAEFWHKFNRALGAKVPERVIDSLISGDLPDRELVELIASLRKDYPVSALSNTPREWVSDHERNYGLHTWFDHRIYSCDLGFAKPDPRIYRELEMRSGIPLEETVHIDDREFAVEGARQAGLHAIRYKDNLRLKVALRGFGVRF